MQFFAAARITGGLSCGVYTPLFVALLREVILTHMRQRASMFLIGFLGVTIASSILLLGVTNTTSSLADAQCSDTDQEAKTKEAKKKVLFSSCGGFL
jgi:MFS family permease